MTDDEWLIIHAGADYNTPKRIELAGISFDDHEHENVSDFIKALTTFRDKNADATIEVVFNENYNDGSTYFSGYCAFRYETADEVRKRIAGYLEEIETRTANAKARRLAEYERLKREFEGK